MSTQDSKIWKVTWCLKVGFCSQFFTVWCWALRHPLGMNLNYKIISFFPHPRQSYTELSNIQLTSLQLYRALSFFFGFASFLRNAYEVFLYPCIIKTLSAFLKSISYSITFNFNETMQPLQSPQASYIKIKILLYHIYS